MGRPALGYRCGGSRGLARTAFARHRIPVSPATKNSRRTPAAGILPLIGATLPATRPPARSLPQGARPAPRRRRAATARDAASPGSGLRTVEKWRNAWHGSACTERPRAVMASGNAAWHRVARRPGRARKTRRVPGAGRSPGSPDLIARLPVAFDSGAKGDPHRPTVAGAAAGWRGGRSRGTAFPFHPPRRIRGGHLPCNCIASPE